MPLLGALILFGIFAANVAFGAASNAAFLSDVGEMLVLGGTAILFVIAVLQKEAAAKKARGTNRPGRT